MFTIFLPEAKGDLPHMAGPGPEGVFGGDESILFVDDEEMICAWVRKILEQAGYQVTAMTNSLQAWELFESQPNRFDLLITDESMPVLSGHEIASRVKKLRPEIPIVLCTGYSDSVTPESAERYGIVEIVYKPFETDELIEIIRRVLDSGRFQV